MTNLTHLERLEAESIDIMREAVSESDRPVMLYSIGRDSAVMLQLAMKAFYPSKPPFPLLHVDTTWKFREMIEFRDRIQPDTRMTGGLYQTGQGRPMARRVRDITGSGKRRPCGARAAPSCQAIQQGARHGCRTVKRRPRAIVSEVGEEQQTVKLRLFFFLWVS